MLILAICIAKKLIVQGRAGVPWQKASGSCGRRPPPAPMPLRAGPEGARLPSSGHCCFGISSGLAAGPWDGFRAGARGWEKGEAVGMSSSPIACPLQALLLVTQRLIQSAQHLRGLVLLVISLINISCKGVVKREKPTRNMTDLITKMLCYI